MDKIREKVKKAEKQTRTLFGKTKPSKRAVADAKRRVKKGRLPRGRDITAMSKQDKQMGKFLKQWLELTGNPEILEKPIDEYSDIANLDPIIRDGVLYFMDKYKSDAKRGKITFGDEVKGGDEVKDDVKDEGDDEDDVKDDEDDVDEVKGGDEPSILQRLRGMKSKNKNKTRDILIKDWNRQESQDKLYYIFLAYGHKERVEFGRKEFIITLTNVLGRKSLRKFINDYLNSGGESYQKFFQVWKENKKIKKKIEKLGKKTLQEDIEFAKSRKHGGGEQFQIPLTEEEQLYLELLNDGIQNENNFNIEEMDNLNLNGGQIKTILRQLSAEDVQLIAEYVYNIPNPSIRGKSGLINTIFRKTKTGKRPIVEVVSKPMSKWVYQHRKKELLDMDVGHLTKIAKQLDIIVEKMDITEIVKSILDVEKNFDRIMSINEDKREKMIEKIARITGRSEENYILWTVEQLESKLDELGNENVDYWRKLEK